MANFRIKASGTHSDALDTVIEKVCAIASEKENKDVLVLVSQLNLAKDDDRIEKIFGSAMFDRLVKKRETSVGLGEVNFEVQPYDYLKNGIHRAHDRTVLVLNPSISDLNDVLHKGNTFLDWVVVEIHYDGELDSWVQAHQATDI